MKPKFSSLKCLIIVASLTGIPACGQKDKIYNRVSDSPTVLPQKTPSHPRNQPLPKSRIREKAKKVTVFITHGGQGLVGSGVIIGQSGKTLYILTASHVIGIPPQIVDKGNGKSEPEDPYEVTTNDGEKFEVGYSDYNKIVKPLPNNIDLAVLELESTTETSNQDRVATLSSSLSKNMPIYIFGYIPCSPSAKEDKAKVDQFSSGKVSRIARTSEFDHSDELGGYDLHYNNNTVQGMSGSPVFDAAGRVVAIHAKTDRTKYINSKACQPLPSKPKPGYGDNLGISIKSFANLKSSWPRGLKSILAIDSSPGTGVTVEPPPPPLDPTPTPVNSCPPFISPDDPCLNTR